MLIKALTAAGFFYQGPRHEDYVRCFHCGGTLSIGRHCGDGQDPILKHLERQPHCQHAQRLQAANSNDQSINQGGSTDITNPRGKDLPFQEGTDSGDGTQNTDDDEDSSMERASGSDVGLRGILADRLREGEDHAASASIDDSLGDQIFWRPNPQVGLCILVLLQWAPLNSASKYVEELHPIK